ncbi:hypothetical protein KKD42_00290, partial [Patescibacteria group bacterium]|nr:hypothetical protein [Patescibacteria group bacterium]
NRDYSENVAVKIDEEIDRIMREGLDTALKIIDSNKAAIEKVSEALIERETLERKDFYDIVGITPANPKNVLGLVSPIRA